MGATHMTVPTPPNSGMESPPGGAQGPPSVADTPTSRRKRNGPPREFVLHAGLVALTPEEVQRVLEPVDVLEERALLELALTTGIRREDLVSIPLEGVDLERGAIRFHERKKARNREIPVQGRALVDLRTHVRNLDRGERWLFPSPRLRGRHQTGRFAWNIWNRWLRRAGLSPRPFHATRATAYKLAKFRGWPVELAAAILGDTVRVAEAYYGTPTPGELAQIARERPLL
jgi:integrase